MNPISMHLIDIESLTLPQAQELVDFHNAFYGTGRTAEQLFWEYRTFDPGKAVFAAARDRGRLIATQAMLPIPMKIGNQSVMTAKSENTLLLPGYRGTGVMKALYESAVERCRAIGLEFIWGFTGATKAFESFGFTVTPLPQVFSRPNMHFGQGLSACLRQPDALGKKLKAVSKYGFNFLRAIRWRSSGGLEERPGFSASTSALGEPLLSEFCSDLASRHPEVVALDLGLSYLDWRVRRHPSFNYREYQILEGDRLQTFAFVALSNGVVSISHIASRDEHGTLLLLQSVLNDFSDRSFQFRLMINPRARAFEAVLPALNRLGFRSRTTWNLVVRDLSGGKHKAIFDSANWAITGLWTEGYSM